MDIRNPTTFRENVSNRFHQIIQEKDLAINIEKGIYNYSIKEAASKKIIKKWDNPTFVLVYVDRLRSVYTNLKKNKDLQTQLLSKEITPQTLAFMTHQELHPELWKELIDKKIKRDANKFTTHIQASTDMFTCKKCRSKRCTYYELQTRSADEPATIFVTCLDCGKNFKS
jgi:transcription elongation factor S-II